MRAVQSARPHPSGKTDKTMIVFTLPNPGALFKALSVFALHSLQTRVARCGRAFNICSTPTLRCPGRACSARGRSYLAEFARSMRRWGPIVMEEGRSECESVETRSWPLPAASRAPAPYQGGRFQYRFTEPIMASRPGSRSGRATTISAPSPNM